MKIILGGGGDEVTAIESHQKFYDNLKHDKRILYIPIALLGHKHTAEDCLNWFKKAFDKFPLNEIDVLTDFSSDITDTLSSYDGIYIGGGNTYKLLKGIYETSFDKKLIKYLQEDGIIYGGSAGAIIFGKSIDTARYSDENDYNLVNTNGLDLVENYSIWCHYTEKDNTNINLLIREGLKILAISEDSAVYANNGKLEIIGQNVKRFG